MRNTNHVLLMQRDQFNSWCNRRSQCDQLTGTPYNRVRELSISTSSDQKLKPDTGIFTTKKRYSQDEYKVVPEPASFNQITV